MVIMKVQIIAIPFDKPFRERHELCEHYVALHSSVFKKLFGWDDSQEDNFEGLVKISNPYKSGKSVYRRAVGHSYKGLDGKHGMLGHRTRKMLQAGDSSELIIQPTCWFWYLWYHYDSVVCWPFRLAILFGLLNIVGLALPFIVK